MCKKSELNLLIKTFEKRNAASYEAFCKQSLDKTKLLIKDRQHSII